MRVNVFAVQIRNCRIERLNRMASAVMYTHTLYFSV